MQIVSISLRDFPYDSDVERACVEAYEQGTLIFALSGNSGSSVENYPAAYDGVIAVGAVDPSDNWASFSNYGYWLDFVAPGWDIYSTIRNNGYGNFTGTSMACPHVAATAALIRGSKEEAEYGNVWNTTTIIRKLRDTALNLGGDEGWDEKYGYGLVNAWQANQRPTGDIKRSDNYVNAKDAIVLGRAWGTNSSNPNEHTRNADINIDNYVNAKDAVLLGGHFEEGKSEGRKDGGSKEDQYSSKLKVQPESNVFYTDTANIGDNFTISIIADNVTDLYGWEFKLTWTPGLINCTTETLNENLWTDYSNPWISSPIDNENGTYHQCLTARSLVPSFNGSTWLVNLTFQIIQAPPEGGILSTDINLSATSGLTYSLLNSSALEIPHNFVQGSYSYVSPRYMRSDTHTINGLLAYKLNSSQSASYLQTSITDTESNTVYWGIRVWKRSSAGSETEITSGTPVAQVSRSLSGYGIQSATWNCPNTTLAATDSVVVRVYCKNGGDWTLQATFTTTQLNAQTADPTTWTVYYWTKRNYIPGGLGRTIGYFRWGAAVYNSRTENFTVTPN